MGVVLTYPVKGRSAWHAAFNPVFIEAQRKDWIIGSYADNGGYLQITIVGAPPLPTLTGKVYVQGGFVDGTYTVLSNTVDKIVIDLAYDHQIIGVGAGYVNFLAEDNNYTLQTEIYLLDQTKFGVVYSYSKPYSYAETKVATRIDYFDYKGYARIYLHPYASRLVSMQDTFSYNGTTQDYLAFCSIRPVVSAVNAPSEIGDQVFENKQYLHFVCSANQKKYFDGSQKSNYVPDPYYGPFYGIYANWLSDFKRPKMWVKPDGFGNLRAALPFDMSFIISELMNEGMILLDGYANGSLVGVGQFSSIWYYAIQRTLPTDTSIPDTCDRGDLYISAWNSTLTKSTYVIPPTDFKLKPMSIYLGQKLFGLSGTICNDMTALVSLLNSELPLDDYGAYTVTDLGGGNMRIDYPSGARPAQGLSYIADIAGSHTPTQIATTPSGGNQYDSLSQVSEKITIDFVSDICENPVYLKWIGPTGGWNYYLFKRNQYITNTAKINSEFQKNFDDISVQESDTEVLQKEAGEDWVIGCDSITDDEWLTLQTLFNSPVIKMMTNPLTWDLFALVPIPPEWITVKIQGKIPVKQTKHSRHSFECTIKLPDINLQWQ